MGRKLRPLPIQTVWLAKIERTPEPYKIIYSNAEFYLVVGSTLDVPDENDSVGRWLSRQDKVIQAKRNWWQISGAALGVAYALSRMIQAHAYFTSLIVCGLIGAWVGGTLAEKSPRERLDFFAPALSAIALNFFYSRSLQHFWPATRICCGSTQVKEDHYGLESMLLTIGTMLLYFYVQDRLSKRKQ